MAGLIKGLLTKDMSHVEPYINQSWQVVVVGFLFYNLECVQAENQLFFNIHNIGRENAISLLSFKVFLFLTLSYLFSQQLLHYYSHIVLQLYIHGID